MWYILIAIVIIIIVLFKTDQKEMIAKQVSSQGGMQIKYAEIINWLTEASNARITNITSGSIDIVSERPNTKVEFLITETFGKVNIRWKADLGNYLGRHSYQWNYPHDYPQETIIKEIGEYLQYKMSQMGLS